MNLLNQHVEHRSFGPGEVVEQEDQYIEVRFGEEKRRFVYPDAFGKFLTLVDEETARKVEKIRQNKLKERKQRERQVAKKRALAFERRQRQLERERIMRNHKLSPVSQAAFWVDEEEREKVFAEWRIFTGVRKSGAQKGRPNRLVRLHQNSSIIVTAREAKTPEKERRITGIFMVDEGFIGRLCEDGYIPAHPKFRLRLSAEESRQMPFWKYYINERYPENMTWNSGRHRYFENIWAAQVLQDIIKLRQDAEELPMLEEFFFHFLLMNELDEDALPEPNGVLVRLNQVE